MTHLEADVRVQLGAFRLDARVTAGEGEVVAVVGPNGSGKTTLLRAVAGLQPMDGAVSLGGAPLDGPPESRAIGMVFNDGALFPHLSALDNVAFGVPRKNKAVAREWIDRVGLTGHEHLKPEQLSAGMRQRVALARALAPHPRLLLLDEPLAAVDLASRPGLRRLLADVLAELDATCLLVTHDPVDARALAHRMVVLEDGLVVQEGSPADLTAHPRSPWVAEMVGLNVLPAGFAVGAPDGPAVVEPKAVLLSRARPETSARNVWAGRVNGVDREGERVRVSIRLDAGPDLVAEVTPAAVDDLGLVPGTQVWALVKASEVRGLTG